MEDGVQSVSCNFEVLARTGRVFGEQEFAYVLQNFIAVKTRRFRTLPDCPLIRRVRRVSQRCPLQSHSRLSDFIALEKEQIQESGVSFPQLVGLRLAHGLGNLWLAEEVCQETFQNSCGTDAPTCRIDRRACGPG